MHGEKWNWSDIQEAVEWARKQEREKKTWVAHPPFVAEGHTIDFVGPFEIDSAESESCLEN